MSVLDEITAYKRQVVAQRKLARPIQSVRRAAESAPPPRDFTGAIAADGLSVISEVKRASPAKGAIDLSVDAPTLAGHYQAAGASAISVLTDEKYFNGSDDDLVAVRGTVGVPVLRKEFIVDPYQIYESRALGADVILLIVASLEPAQISEYRALAESLGMATLVEVHDEAELQTALSLGSPIVGINNRNLKTLAVDLATTERLRPLVPSGILTVGESGIRSAEDAHRLRAVGVDAVLVGEALVRAPDVTTLIGDMRRQPAATSAR
ncbi:MAG: indole-3-glycerol phosphate synthase TrpC [Chloroflexota bacterium]